MKIIFLDIDGILNSETMSKFPIGKSYNTIYEFHVNILNFIIDSTDAKIVIHSTRRSHFDIKEQLIKAGVRDCIIGITSIELKKDKGIIKWLKEHPEVDRYVILDDNLIFDLDADINLDNFIKISSETGLILTDAKKAIWILEPKEENKL